MSEGPEPSLKWIVVSGLFGFAAAWLLILLAIAMAGAGHGWTSAFKPSLCSLVALPLLGAVAAMPSSKTKLVLSLAFVVAAVLGDVLLMLKTQGEGVEYFRRAVNFGFPIAATWFFIWGGAQIVAATSFVVTLLRLRRNSRLG